MIWRSLLTGRFWKVDSVLFRVNQIIACFILGCSLTASLLPAQSPPTEIIPPIGVIEFYGLRKVSEAQVREVLGVKEGDQPPSSTSAIEKRLEKIPGVLQARVGRGCCHAGKATLSVGIQEEAAPRLDFRTPPQSDIALPQEVVEDYENFGEAMMEAVFRGDAGEDFSEGHSLADNPAVRAVQERFIVHAERHLKRLREVLRDSADAQQRAIAAIVMGYAFDKRAVLDDLQSAVRDSDKSVRNNAMRSLAAIAAFAQRQPELGIEISPTGFIEMLNSIIMTDRGKAMMVLSSLTEDRDPAVLQQLRERALPSLVEMARFKSTGLAIMAYVILGRMAGLSDEEIGEAWSSGERESVITQVLKSR